MKYVKSFDVLGIDTAQIPCIELQGVPNAATVGAVGLLGMDVTSEGREIYVCTAVNGAIYTWQPLKDGKDGTCVVKSEINDNGELILTLSDGKTLNAGVAKGAKGEKGDPGNNGVGVEKVEVVNGELIVTFSDGTSKNAGKVDGADGQDGVSIVKIESNASSELLITLSNDTIINVGSMKGDKGDKGDQGIQGIQGEKGDKGDPGDKWYTVKHDISVNGYLDANGIDIFAMFTLFSGTAGTANRLGASGIVNKIKSFPGGTGLTATGRVTVNGVDYPVYGVRAASGSAKDTHIVVMCNGYEVDYGNVAVEVAGNFTEIVSKLA